MAVWLRRLINIRVGEGRRTALIYALFFLLILGSVWGETTAEALFLDKVGTDAYSFRFITEALFILIFTLVYTAFVDRVNNTRLLTAICVLVGLSLLVTRFLLNLDLPSAFYLFYLVSRTARIIFTVHSWTYASDFYDTRAAKRIFPLIGSSGRVAGLVGGVTLRFVVIPTVHAENVPYIWIGLLAVGAWLTLNIPRWIGEDVTSPQARGQSVGVLKSFQDGWRSIRGSHLLRLLAIGTAVMTVLLSLLNFQVDYIFSQTHRGADELAGLFGLLRGLADGIALPFQLFLLTRIVNRVGVGWVNLFYPLLAVASYGLLGASPLFPLAVLGLFVQKGFRSGVRNPLDTMLYNAVPRVVKGRARAFVNAILAPLATLLSGVILFLVPRGSGLPWYLFALGGAVGLGYLVVTWRIRPAYSQALVETLEVEDTALYQLAGAEWDATDRAALDHVLARLRESADRGDDGTTIFLAQLAYEIGDHDALPALSEISAACGPAGRSPVGADARWRGPLGTAPRDADPPTGLRPIVRAAILEIIRSASLSDPLVRQLCIAGLGDADPDVRRAALAVLDAQRQSGAKDLPLLALALNHLDDSDAGVRVRAISLLLRSGDFYYLTAAAGALNELLNAGDPALRALALSALGELGDPRFVRTLLPHLSDPSESVRRAAALATAAAASKASAAPSWVCDFTLEAAQQALSDRAETVRLAAIQILAQLASSKIRPMLLKALQDDSVRVRESARQVLESMGAEAVDGLEELLDTAGGRAREAAIVALLHLSTEQYRSRADAEIHDVLERAYRNLVLVDALTSLDFSGAALAVRTLNDRNQARLDHVFRILAALHEHEAVQVIRHNLQASRRSVGSYGTMPDTHARANAVEALEAMTSPLVARLVAPLSADGASSRRGQRSYGASPGEMAALAYEEFDLRPTDPAAALGTLLTGQDPWLVAVGIYLAGETEQSTSKLISRARCEEAITTAMDSADPLLAETAQHVARRLGLLSAGEEVSAMLSTIEKVIFLKEVPIFNEMTVAQIRALAGIAEEVNLDDDDIIFREGEAGDTLYVVVSGRVGLEHKAQSRGGGSGSVARLATLESRQYFGEMSIFDQSPRSASAIAVGQTLLLSIRREPLIALVEGDPTLALELIRVLSQRLREANEQLALKTKAAPRKLQKLYDQLM